MTSDRRDALRRYSLEEAAVALRSSVSLLQERVTAGLLELEPDGRADEEAYLRMLMLDRLRTIDTHAAGAYSQCVHGFHGTAQGAREEAPAAPALPSSTSEIEIATAEIPALVAEIEELGDYGDEIETLVEAQDTLQTSIEQLKQVTNPAEAFVIERIQDLPSVAGVQAVTEDNDPNGNLNKQGGYTATVYLSSALVDQSVVAGTDIVNRGTDGGGAVEVYATVEDAQARDAYLGAFDSGILRSGSHVVLGTVVIRTSDMLTASQQQELERAIHDALIRID